MAGPGIMIPAFADTTERRMARAKERYSFAEVVEQGAQRPAAGLDLLAVPKLGHS